MSDEEQGQDFAQSLPSTVKLQDLQIITEHLDHELGESQRIMKDIRTMYDDVSKLNDAQPGCDDEQPSDLVRHEDVSKFLEADAPKLLMSDMPEGAVEVDIDVIIDSMKKRAEELRKIVLDAQSEPQDCQKEFENLDIKQYATTLNHLSKRLENIKLKKTDEFNIRDGLLEEKLMKLCQDVNLFTQMFQTKLSICECYKNWPDRRELDKALYYDNEITQLVACINEITYLLSTNKRGDTTENQ